MPDINQKVKATLELAREGDAEIFKKAADDAKNLGTAGDSVAAALGHANQALASLDSSSLARAGRSAAELKLAVDQYEHALEAAKAAGQNVTGNQEAALQQLQSAYARATTQIGAYRNAQRDVREAVTSSAAATQLQRGSINDLGDVASVASPKLARIVGTAGAIGGAFTAGWEAGTLLRKGLNELTDGGFDQGVQRIATSMGLLKDETTSAQLGVSTLASMQKRLKAEGIDPTNMSIVDQQRKLEELSQKHKAAADAIAQSVTKFVASTGLGKQAIEAEASALVNLVNKFADLNPQLNNPQLGKIFHDQLQAIIDKSHELGIAVPQAFDLLAGSLGVVSSAAEKQLQHQKDLVSQFTQQITGQVTITRQELETQGAALGEALSHIDFSTLGGKSLDEAKAKVQQLVDSFRNAGLLIPESLGAAADKVGVLLGATERLGEGVVSFAGKATNMAGSTLEIGTAVDEAGNKIATITQKAQAAGEQLAGAGDKASKGATDIQQLGTAADTAAAGLEKAGDKGQAVASGTQAAATAADAFSKSFQLIVATVNSAATALAAYGQAVANSTAEANAALDGLIAKWGQVQQAAAAADSAMQQAVDSGSGGG